EEINDTQYAQPAIFLISYLLASKLNVKPDYVAGLSLGEYSALCYANVFSFNEGLEITSKRGVIMNKALENTNSGMYAILGSDSDTINSVVSKIDGVEVANYNCPGQIVITGYLDKLEEAVKQLTDLGVRRCIKLNVSGAFHSSLLNEASNELREVLNNYNFSNKETKVVFNTLGNESSDDIKDILQNQIKSSVLFEQSIEYMIAQGVTTFIEIGSKNNLSGFVKKINRDVKILNVYDFETLKKVGEEL
ncbi:MAG: ACP S-malonyltransferase, partial [bacterium]